MDVVVLLLKRERDQSRMSEARSPSDTCPRDQQKPLLEVMHIQPARHKVGALVESS